MKREFTQEKYDYFCRVIDGINDSQWCGISDWFGDRYLDVKHWLGDLGLYDYTQNMDKYHREVLDRKNSASSQIRQIFEEVSSIDDQFASGTAGGFQQNLDMLDSYRAYLRYLTEIAVSGSDAVASGGKLTDCFNPANIRNILDTAYNRLCSGLVNVCFDADSFYQITNKYKREYVELYERQNPEQAAVIDNFLSDPNLSAEERRDIKFLIYNAPEPYKSIYIQHIEKYEIVVYNIGDSDAKKPNGTNIEGTFYNPPSGKIYIHDDADNFYDDPLGPYDTVFHETGHAIDDYENATGVMRSGNYVYEGRELQDWIVDDVRNYVGDYIDETYPNLTDEQKEDLMRSLNLTDDASFAYKGQSDDLDPKLKYYRKEIVRDLRKNLGGEENAPASDVFGGVTNNAIKANYGHTSDEYWYVDGKTTEKQSAELWAEFFAAKMTHDTESLESIREHFPNAYKAMEAMAQDMAKSR